MIIIKSNGSQWAGDQPETIEQLIDLLGREPLDPKFEEYGGFYHPARACRVEYNDDHSARYVDAGSIYEGIDAIRFWGNFVHNSHCFEIDTDEPAVIEALTAAIRANQASSAYLAARQPRPEPAPRAVPEAPRRRKRTTGDLFSDEAMHRSTKPEEDATV